MRVLPALGLLILGCAAAMAQPMTLEQANGPANVDFVKGADLSLASYLQGQGVKYKDGGQVKDVLEIFKDHGCNYVRLRIFVNPDGTHGQVNTLAYTLALAKQVKALGLPLLLDFHYSDGWADPGKQYIPKEWAALPHKELTDKVYTYTRDTLAAFKAAGCLPDMVQVGNEVSAGMMWPAGGPLKDDSKWDDFADFLKAGIRAVHEYPGMKAVIHLANGDRQGLGKWFFNHCAERGVDYDVIGLSYYPFGDGTLDELKANLAFLSTTYHKDIMVVETGFFADGGSPGKTTYPTTPAGQAAFLAQLMSIVASTPDGHGKGVFYWAPEMIRSGGVKGAKKRGNRALFDDSGNALPAIDAFSFALPQSGAGH
jgi:arabinogalactan endo-1,4-beta-galactosidase